MMLSNITIFVKEEKDLSEGFDTARGFRQCGPLSFDLFNFVKHRVLHYNGTVFTIQQMSPTASTL